MGLVQHDVPVSAVEETFTAEVSAPPVQVGVPPNAVEGHVIRHRPPGPDSPDVEVVKRPPAFPVVDPPPCPPWNLCAGIPAQSEAIIHGRRVPKSGQFGPTIPKDLPELFPCMAGSLMLGIAQPDPTRLGLDHRAARIAQPYEVPDAVAEMPTPGLGVRLASLSHPIADSLLLLFVSRHDVLSAGPHARPAGRIEKPKGSRSCESWTLVLAAFGSVDASGSEAGEHGRRRAECSVVRRVAMALQQEALPRGSSCS